eukprot:gene15305-20283_t
MAGAQPNLWAALTAGIDALPGIERWRLRLSRDETFFWGTAHRLILHESQTTARLAALGAAGVPVACIGNLDAGAPGVPGNLVAAQGRVGFSDGLPEALSRTEVTLDVLNPGFIEGYSHKPVLGFAAGGFVLVNRVAGWVDSFGEAGAASSWTDHADLAAKLDRYLSRPALRREIAGAIRAEILARHTLGHALTRVLTTAAAAAAQSRSRRLASSSTAGGWVAQWASPARIDPTICATSAPPGSVTEERAIQAALAPSRGYWAATRSGGT